MLKIIVFISLFGVTAFADMTSFYQVALEHLQYDKSYALYEQSNKTSQSAVSYNKYANFSADASYTRTHAALLPTSSGDFNTADIALHDTIDLFGKNNYQINTLRFDIASKQNALALKKEQLFIALINMITLYHRTEEQLLLHKDLYEEQLSIYKKLEPLAQNGDITALDILRFKNTLTTLNTKIIAQTQELEKMKAQLQLYAPGELIPDLNERELHYDKKAFLSHDPSTEINRLDAERLIAQSEGLNNTYMPTADIAVGYQKLDDPTSYGDNYSVGIALHIPLNGGDFKEAEALKVSARSKETETIEYRLQRENAYIQYHQAYINAQKQLDVLEGALQDYNTSEETIKKAYLQQYVDFNTYLQVLTQALDVKKQLINMKYQEILNATIINAISKGAIYE